MIFFKNLNAAPEGDENINLPTLNPYDINRLNENLNENNFATRDFMLHQKVKE